MRRIGLMIVLGALMALTASEVFAQAAPAGQGQGSQMWQPWLDRGYFNFNVGFETTSGTLSDDVTFPLYGEIGSKEVDQNVDSGSVIDFSVGTRVWQNVSVGIGYHRGANSSEASASASVPHVLVTDRLRRTTATAGDLSRRESAFHLQFGYMIPLSDLVSVHVTVGPSFFRLKQDVLANLTFTESPSFETVTATPVILERSDNVTGVNIGVDVAYQLYDGTDYKVGGGVFLRYAGASARIPILERDPANSIEVDTDVGGLQIGFGARVRF
jgi:hypothetical protein